MQADTGEATAAEKEKSLKELQKHRARKVYYEQLAKQVAESKDGQLSATDPESRALILHRNIVEAGYNVQTAVDEKHKLVVHLSATSRNDARALVSAAKGAKAALGAKGRLATVPALWRRIRAHSRLWWRVWFAAAGKLLSGRAAGSGLQCFEERH